MRYCKFTQITGTLVHLYMVTIKLFCVFTMYKSFVRLLANTGAAEVLLPQPVALLVLMSYGSFTGRSTVHYYYLIRHRFLLQGIVCDAMVRENAGLKQSIYSEMNTSHLWIPSRKIKTAITALYIPRYLLGTLWKTSNINGVFHDFFHCFLAPRAKL